MSAPSTRPRLEYLDAMRGVAALVVVVFHYVYDQLDAGTLQGGDAWFGRAVTSEFDLGKMGVALFFLISGFIIPNSLDGGSEQVPQFAISRFFRLYPLYWLAVAIGIFLPWPAAMTFGRGDILANMTMIQGFLGHPNVVGAAWTLQIELVFYGVCALLAVCGRIGSPAYLVGLSALFLATALAMAVARYGFVLKLPVALPLALSLMFFGSVWRKAVLERDPAALKMAPWLAGALMVAIVPISVIGYNHDFGFHERWQPYVACYETALVLFMTGTTVFRVSWRPLVWAGEISYSVYLLHPLVASGAYRFGLSPGVVHLPPLLFCVALLAVVLGVATLSYRLIERPAVRLGRRFGRRAPKPQAVAMPT